MVLFILSKVIALVVGCMYYHFRWEKWNSSDSYANDGYCNDFSPQYHGENDDQHSHFGYPTFIQTQVELNISLLRHRPPLLHTDLVDSEDPKADHVSHKHLRFSNTAKRMLIGLPTKDTGFLIGKILGRFANTQWIIENFGGFNNALYGFDACWGSEDHPKYGGNYQIWVRAKMVKTSLFP